MVTTITKCNSCDLSSFSANKETMPSSMEDWLVHLPGVNYQCYLRRKKVMALARETCDGKETKIVHFFLAVGCEQGCNVPGNSDEIARTRDVYICWILETGQIYAVDAHNLSELFMKSLGQEERYATRWVGCNQPQLLQLAKASGIFDAKVAIGTKSAAHDLTTAMIPIAFRTPYLIRGDSEVGRSLEHRALHLLDTIAVSIKNFAKAISNPIPPTIAVNPVDPARLPLVHSVAVQIICPDHQSDAPNAASVTFLGAGIVAKCSARDLFPITDAYDLRDGVVGSPQVVVIQMSGGWSQEASIEVTFDLAKMPNLMRSLALLRIWSERPKATSFHLEADQCEVPFTCLLAEK